MSSESKSPPAVKSALREFIRQELHGIYTATFVVVESVDRATQRAAVTLKSSAEVWVDDVPVASPFATDGAGMVTPVREGDEGILLHTKEPLDRKIVRHDRQRPQGERRFTLEDGVLLPMLWLDVDDVPRPLDESVDEFTVAVHDDGSILRMLADGRVRIEHGSGNAIAMDENGVVTIGDENSAAPLAFQDHTHAYTDTLADGSESTRTTDPPSGEGTSDLEAS